MEDPDKEDEEDALSFLGEGDTTTLQLTLTASPASGETSKTSKQSKKWTRKVKKSHTAPKRFRSAYIFFSAQKHKEIQEQLAEQGILEKVSAVYIVR